MAGRPVTRARTFAEWEDRLWQMRVELFEMMPPRQAATRQREDGPDFWAQTFALLDYTTDAASRLRFLLEGKAGLDAEALQAERERARGVLADEAADGDGASDEATAENAQGATA